MIMFGYPWRPMMNFKFRVWHKPSKKFVKESQRLYNKVEYCDDGLLSVDCDGILHNTHASSYKDYVVQISTGMKDSCGVEIYEGDIVQKDNHTAEVFWNDTIGGFDLAWRENKYIHDEHSYVFNFRNLLIMKVIGHINELAV